jgi:hypothetical protein
MTLTRREKILIVGGLIVVTVVMYLLYFLMPYLNNMTDAKKKLNDAQTQLSMLNNQSTMSAQLESQIADFENQLKTDWSSIPAGIDHARILLYLKGITDARAENVSIAVPGAVAAAGPFMTQTFTLDFKTTYQDLLHILGVIKKNELYSRIALMKAEYHPPPTEPTAITEPAPAADATPAAAVEDKNVIAVPIEFVFYAPPPAEGVQPEPVMPPTNTQRATPLMPAN